eukprot:jgi/Ulvmu1/6389/UM003_0017.1
MHNMRISRATTLSRCPRRAPASQNRIVIARGDYFGKDGMRQQLGGQGGADLNKLLGGTQPLDLGPTSAPTGGEDDPLNFDPEGLYKNLPQTSMQDGHIERRALTKDVASEEEMEKEMKKQKEKLLKEAEERRAGITAPTEPALLIDFLLECDSQDTEHFVIQQKENLGTEFFAALDTRIGQERFLPEPDEDTLAELEGLRLYVEQTLQAQTSVMKGVQSAKERLTKMLSSKDLKATILEMAGAGEIDVALLQLLQQNIDGAEASGQKDAAAFMGKVRDFAARYVIVPKRSEGSGDASVKAALKAEQAARSAKETGGGDGANGTGGGSGLIMP